MKDGKILDKSFYLQDTNTVARELLGKVLVLKFCDEFKLRIVETESYLTNDRACHAFNGKKTNRTEVMFKEGGRLYIYFTYGMYNMLNIVTREEDLGEAVLIRGVEPLNNFDKISLNRFNKPYKELKLNQKKNLTNGPGKLTKALGIDRNLNGYSLLGDKLYILDDGYREFNIVTTKRIGIDYAQEAKDYLQRFYIEGNEYVSSK